MAAQPGQKPFSWHVSRIVKPRLLEMGFRAHGSSSLYDRPLGRGLVEYVLWVCHRYRDALHVQWGVRHGACDALYGSIRDYTREENPGEFTFQTDAELVSALEIAFQQWLKRRRFRLSRMERSLRRDARAKADLIRWHGLWREYTSARLEDVARVQKYFSRIPQEIVQGAWKFVKGFPVAPRGNPSLPRWEYFVMLKEYQVRPSRFKGSWWDLYGYADWPASFFANLHDLDALLEPYDV